MLMPFFLSLFPQNYPNRRLLLDHFWAKGMLFSSQISDIHMHKYLFILTIAITGFSFAIKHRTYLENLEEALYAAYSEIGIGTV